MNKNRGLTMSIPRMTEILDLAGTNDPSKHFFQLVSSNGDGTGVVDLNAAAPADYFITPSSSQKIILKRLNLLEKDLSFTNALGYGAGSALTNGIGITVENGSGVIRNYTPVKIKTTYEWALLAGVDSSSIGGSGADPHMVRWTFNKGGGNIKLDGSKGEFLRISYGDAMNFMDFIRIMVQGHLL